MSGAIYGIGAGCGDPADVTTNAIDTIKRCDLIIFPSGRRAYDIIKGAYPDIDSRNLKFFSFPMIRDPGALEERRREIYSLVKPILSGGGSAGFVTIGDPLIYSTFSYIKELAEGDGYQAQSVSGIPSFLSCAARLGLVLGQDDEQIHIIPGSSDIGSALSLPGIKVFMKLGKSLPGFKNALSEGRGHCFLGAVVKCGMPDEIVCTGIDQIPDEGSYLCTAFVR